MHQNRTDFLYSFLKNKCGFIARIPETSNSIRGINSCKIAVTLYFQGV